MAQGERDLHSVAVRTRLGEELGLGKRVPAGTPRNALTRLQKAELVTRVAHGDYQIQDEGLQSGSGNGNSKSRSSGFTGCGG